MRRRRGEHCPLLLRSPGERQTDATLRRRIGHRVTGHAGGVVRPWNDDVADARSITRPDAVTNTDTDANSDTGRRDM